MSIREAEMWVVCSLVILAVTEWPRQKELPLLFKMAHFGFVGLFSLMSISGVHYLLLMCINYGGFIEIFSKNIPRSINPQFLKIIIVVYCLIGLILFFGALRLGRFRRWGRQVVIIFSIPYSMLYPSVEVMMAGRIEMPHAGKIIWNLSLILLSLSIAAVAMYASQRFSRYVVYLNGF